MLKITILDSGAEQKLMVEGRVAEPWVSELESAWKRARRAGDGRPIEIDLSEMTFIDSAGEAALMAMIAEGATLAAKGVYCKYVVEQLVTRVKRLQNRRQGSNGAGERHSNSTSQPVEGLQGRPIKETH